MRVMLIDDHALFRAGLRGLLEQLGVEVMATTGDCNQGIEEAVEHPPDLLLLDMRMPQMSGIEVLKELRSKAPQLPVVMLTTSRQESDVIESLQNGARGYLLKEMEPDELFQSLEKIMAGDTVVASELTGVLAKAVQGENDSTADNKEGILDRLTPREREILCYLIGGDSNKVIARNLGISDGTVKLHVKAILRKLKVHSRVEAAVIAVEEGLCNRSRGST